MTAPVISAQVVLRPASSPDPGGLVTSANIAEYAAPPGVADALLGYFAEAGFSVEPVLGISFSITGPSSLFAKVFGEEPRLEERAGVQSATTAGGHELSLERLPAGLRPYIGAVTFSPPPDFGPTSY